MYSKSVWNEQKDQLIDEIEKTILELDDCLEDFFNWQEKLEKTQR